MNDAKPWYLSKTLWGAAGTILFSFLIAFDIDVTEAEIETLVQLILNFCSIALTIYGRITAKTRIE